MFHERDNTYFGRLADGSVRIIKFKSPAPPNFSPKAEGVYDACLVEFDHVVSPSAWASICAAVSLRGAFGGRFYSAQAFHMNPQG